MVQLIGNLAIGTRSATPGCSGISTGVSFNAMLVTEFSTENQDWNAWSNKGEQEVECSTLTGPVGILAKQAAAAEGSTEACNQLCNSLNFIPLHGQLAI